MNPALMPLLLFSGPIQSARSRAVRDEALYGRTVSRITVLPDVKTTILLDQAVWESLRDYVLSRYGTARKLSAGVSEALRAFDSLGLVATLSNQLKLGPMRYPSSEEVKARRPKVQVSAGRTIREMRDARQTRVSRLK